MEHFGKEIDGRSKSRLWVPGCVMLLCVVLICRFAASGRFCAPPDDTDGVGYEAIAWSLAGGGNFGPKFDDTFIQAYGPAGIPRPLQVWNQMGGQSATAFSPPLHPFILSLIYRAFGRQFCLVRVIYSLILLAGFWLLLQFANSLADHKTVILAASIIAIDRFYEVFLAGFLSETLGFLSSSIVLILTYQVLIPGGIAVSGKMKETFFIKLVALGACLGLQSLIRVAFFFWIIPVVLGIVVCLGIRGLWRHSWKAGLVVGGTSFLVMLPWFARNIALTGEFMPLGTQGPMHLGALYQDEIEKAGGTWDMVVAHRFLDAYKGDEQGIEREVALAKYGLREGSKWISRHLNRMPAILLERLAVFWWPKDRPDIRFYVVLAVIGALWLASKKEEWSKALLTAAILILTAQSLTIMCTHNSPQGRYVFSIQPVLIILCGFGLTAILNALNRAIEGARN